MLSFFTTNWMPVLVSVTCVLLVFVFYLVYQLHQVKKKLRVFFSGSKATDLEEILSREIRGLKQAQREIKELFRLSKAFARISEKSVQKVGLVRFNPFKETGGDQSFALAMLDAQDNGFVISSLFAREGTRIYGKSIKKGKSEYPLSKEEEKALKQAGIGK